jgi:zinc-ribbon domain
MSPENCPHCGADIPPNAKACPECGSDEKTGWSEEAHASGLDLPEEEFDYEAFVKREFGNEKKAAPRGTWFWWLIALLVLLAFITLLVR